MKVVTTPAVDTLRPSPCATQLGPYALAGSTTTVKGEPWMGAPPRETAIL
jgi:hypothetical protein